MPPFDVPQGQTEASWLRELTYTGATVRYGPRQAHPDAWAQIDHELAVIEQLDFPGYELTPQTAEGIPEPVVTHATALLTAPRHLGIHSGGMGDLRPAGHRSRTGRVARMPGRSALQWDKDDCAEIGLTKFDLLGLGPC